jgi:predicted AAA+ superfamily ATPase
MDHLRNLERDLAAVDSLEQAQSIAQQEWREGEATGRRHRAQQGHPARAHDLRDVLQGLADVLRAYASLYLDQEVRPEGWARKVGDFARFLEAISFSHGAVLNTANVARECQVERKTVAAYVEVLEDLLLSFRVPVFTRRARRATSVHPKFFLFDTGVFRSLRPRGPLDRPEEIKGAALEGLVAQHLRAWLAYRGSDAALSFWRTRSGVEVDFVVYGADAFIAIEVKNAARVDPRDLRGLQAFGADYPEAELFLTYRGAARERRGRVWILPVDEFLRSLDPAKGLPHWPP